jgi:hypothetical protein
MFSHFQIWGRHLLPRLSFIEGLCHQSDNQMKRTQSQNCFIPLTPMHAKPPRNYLGHYRKVSLVVEMGQRSVIKFFVKEKVNRIQIIDSVNKQYSWDALQRNTSVSLDQRGELEQKRSGNHPTTGKGTISETGRLHQKSAQRGSQFLNENDCKCFERWFHDGAKPFNEVFGDEMLPYAMGPPHADSGTKRQTYGDDWTHATNAGKLYSLQFPISTFNSISTSCGLAMSHGCSINSIMK